ncbi:MAG: non-canonical purine NTP pyrophosphatase [Chloroflexota bacterium]
MSTPLLLATTNAAKLERLRWLLDGLSYLLLAPSDLVPAIQPDVPEDEEDFAANAAQKAERWSAATGGMLTVASDGGMAIPALGARWDALRTRRQAGAAAHDDDRIRHLLALMRGMHGEERRVVWHEAIALARAGVVLDVWVEQGDGGLVTEDAPDPGSERGFWTERVRWYPALGKRLCLLSDSEREQVNDVWPRLRSRIRAALPNLTAEE